MNRVKTTARWLVRRARENPGEALAWLATLTVLATTAPLWGVTMNRAGDDLYHLANEIQVAMALERGQNPFGPLDMVFGMPVLKFYQPLFYLITGSLHALLGASIVFLHNGLTMLGYALSPLALRWAYRALGLSDLAAGLAALLTLASVAAFGNSYEAYFQAGIVTQSLGAVFFPLFIGSFARLLKEQRGPMGAAALFGLTFVSHVIMAVYAVLAGVLLFLVGRFSLKRLFVKLASFSVLCCLLVGFWVVPFLTHQERHKPVPDLVTRTGTSIWFVGLSPGELNRQLFPGRLLDDAKVLHEDPQGPDDSLTDRLNIMGTLTLRVPFVTVLVLLGLLLCLLRMHSLAHRFLVAGFFFSLLMLLGPDDVPWLNWIPFASRIQAFRCVYLIEFFAFGLAGAGLEVVYHAARRWHQRRSEPGRRRSRIAGWVALGAATVFFYVHIGKLVAVHIDLRDMSAYEKLYNIARHARAGFPLRVADRYKGADRKRSAYMAYKGMRSICGHWGGVGPAVERQLCSRLSSPIHSLGLARRMGIGYYLVGRHQDDRLKEHNKKDKSSTFRRLEHGRGHYLWQDIGASLLWSSARPVLVTANDAQWFHLARSWIRNNGASTGTQGEPPLPVRLTPGQAIDPALLDAMTGVWIFDPDQLESADLQALSNFASRGRPVHSVAPLQGVETRPVPAKGASLITSQRVPSGESEPVFRKRVAQLGGPFEYEVTLAQPRMVLLPEIAVDGWLASVDGQEVPVFAAGPDVVAALVPAGQHRIRFWWATPTRELLLLAGSIATWLALASMIAIGRWRRRG